MAKKPDSTYENNPFMIGLNGLKSMFANAQQLAIYAIVLSVVGLTIQIVVQIVDVITNPNGDYSLPSMDAGQLVVAAILIGSIVFLLLVVSMLLYGVLEYTAARLSTHESVTLKEAFKAVIENLAAYVWLNIVIFVKIFLWSLLLIVPGIIMAVRYSLSGTVFFAEGKHGNAATKRSAELTKGAWFTTFAGPGIWNLLTGSLATPLINPAANSVLYRQLREVTDHKDAKPPAHWLSWLTFFVPIALVIIFIVFAALIALLIIAASTAP